MVNEEFILGYQWSPETGEYLSGYKFPNNKDKVDIHLPPYTTLIEPPVCPKGYTLFWESDINDWRMKKKVVEHPPIHDYASILPEYIQMLKDENMWTDEDDENYQAAIKKIEDDQNRFLQDMDYEKEFRMMRNELLMRSDWTQMNDVQDKFTEEQKQQWIDYRQKLRDLPDVIENVKDIALNIHHPDWPVSPTGSNWN
jgi:hypothetical protein